MVPTHGAAVGESLGGPEPPFLAWHFQLTIKHAAKFILQCNFLEQKLQYFFRSSTAMSALSKWGKRRETAAKQPLLGCYPFMAFQRTVYTHQISPATSNSKVATLWAQIYEVVTVLQLSYTNVSTDIV